MAAKRKTKEPANPRMADYDARNEQRGIVKVAVRIPESRREQLLALCEKWRKEAEGG